MKKIEELRIGVWSQAPEDGRAIEQALRNLGCQATLVGSSDNLVHLARRKALDVVTASLFPGFREPLRLLASESKADLPPMIVVTDAWETELYLEAVELGAFDGLSFPLDQKELRRVVVAAVWGRHLQRAA